MSHVQGDTSERTRESGGTPRPRMENHWAAYWDRLEEHVIFRVEASDYVTRLEAALGLDPRARVLDFGCGFGFIAELLAPRVAELFAFVYRLNQIRQDEEYRGERDPECLSRLEVEDQLELRGLLYWQVARLCTFQDLVDKDSGAPEHLVNIRGIGNEASCLGKGLHPAAGGQPVPLPLNGIQYQNLL